MFIVKKLNKTGGWDSISLIDENNSFRGEARFQTRSEAEAYLKLYKERMNQKLNAVGKAKSRGVTYRIFELDSKAIKEINKKKYPFSASNSLSPLS